MFDLKVESELCWNHDKNKWHDTTIGNKSEDKTDDTKVIMMLETDLERKPTEEEISLMYCIMMKMMVLLTGIGMMMMITGR